MKKFYNFETMESEVNEKLTAFLKESGIYYEKSGCGAGWHFEIECDVAEAEKVNSFLDTILE